MLVFLLLGVSTTLATVPATAAVIEEIMVTAQKRSESINDVPVAISAVDEELMRDAAVDDITNIIPYVPGLTGQSAGVATNSWNIRGIGTNDWSIGSEPAVAVFMDDAYVGRNLIATAAFFDIERVEILKGPQGTLFGRNASAGAINIITNKPSDRNMLELAYGRGNEDTQRIEVIGNLAASDNFGLRVSFLDKQLEGIATNVLNGEEMFQDERAARVAARWNARDNLEILLTGSWSEADGNRVRPHNPTLAALFGLPGANDPFSGETTSDSPNDEETETFGLNLRVNWDINDDLSFTSITDYRDAEFLISQDIDGIGAPLPVDFGDIFLGVPGVLVANGPVRFFQPNVNAKTFGQEFRLNGTSGDFEWFVGVSYFNEDLDEDANVTWPTTMDLDALIGGGGVITVMTDADPAQYFIRGDNDSWGIYGDVAWHLTDRLTLTGGLRWSRDEKDYCARNVDPTFGFLQILGPDTGGAEICDSEDWSELTPRFVIAFEATEETLLYASVARGYKSGGFNSAVAGSGPFGIDPPFSVRSFDPETSTAYEAGLKATLLGGGMQFNLSGYFTDYEDFQLLDTDLSLSITNIGDVESKGVEAEVTWLPAAVEGLTLAANGSFNDSEIDAPGFSIDGSELPQAPEKTFGISARYEWAVGSLGTVAAFAGYNWQDDQLFDVNGARVPQDSYGLLDAALTYRHSSERWYLKLTGRNLTDEDYLIAAQDPLGLGAPYTLRNVPRTWMLQLGVTLGEL